MSTHLTDVLPGKPAGSEKAKATKSAIALSPAACPSAQRDGRDVRGETPRSTESGEAPGWQGATREPIGHIRPRSNAVQGGCIAARMQRGFCHGLLGIVARYHRPDVGRPTRASPVDRRVDDAQQRRSVRAGRRLVGRDRLRRPVRKDHRTAQRYAPESAPLAFAQCLRLFEVAGGPLLIDLGTGDGRDRRLGTRRSTARPAPTTIGFGPADLQPAVAIVSALASRDGLASQPVPHPRTGVALEDRQEIDRRAGAVGHPMRPLNRNSQRFSSRAVSASSSSPILSNTCTPRATSVKKWIGIETPSTVPPPGGTSAPSSAMSRSFRKGISEGW